MTSTGMGVWFFFFFLTDENVLDLDGCDSCTTLQMY